MVAVVAGQEDSGRWGPDRTATSVVMPARIMAGTRIACHRGRKGLLPQPEPALQHIEHENTVVPAPRDRLEAGILARVPHAFATGDTSNRLPNSSNIAFEYVEGEAILLLLNKLGIAASSGSARTFGSLEPSHVMRTMGIPYTAAHGTLRFSRSRYNTASEIERVIEAVPPVIAPLRVPSPYWADGGPATATE